MYALLPMFQRIGSAAYKNDLSNTLKLCEFLGNPQKHLKMVHVAGTNGKGSSAHMIASVLQEAGYNTGLYTSPHLKSFTERIRINGQEVEEAFICSFIDRVKPLIEEIRPSFFEVTVAMAFEYFHQSEVDIAVIEVGLGGRLDSTNIISPLVSLITNIGYDHMDILGHTLPEIALEKAGIIKPKTPVVISQTQDEISRVFTDRAEEMNAPTYFADEEYQLKQTSVSQGLCHYEAKHAGDLMLFSTDLHGKYQVKNIPGVLKIIALLNYLGFMMTDSDIRRGLANVKTNTGLKGRWQKLGDNPLVIGDTVHNISGMDDIIAQIEEQDYGRLFIIWGVVEGKNPELMLKRLPADAQFIFCEPNLPRRMKAEKLHEIAATIGIQGVVIPDVNDALANARNQAAKEDFIFIGGSNFIIAELNEL